MTAPSPPQPPDSRFVGQQAPIEREGIDYEVVGPRPRGGTVKALIVLVAIVFVAGLVAYRVFDWARDRLDPPGEPGASVVLELPAGSTTSGISDLLEENGVIADATIYEWYVRLKGGTAFQAGEYTFFESSAAWEVLDVLRGGPDRVAQAVQVKVTIPEGLTVVQVIELLDEVDGLTFTGAEFETELRTGRVLSRFAPSPGELPETTIDPYEGVLFPDTYFLNAEAEPSDLIAQMVGRFDAVLEEIGYDETIERVGLTPYETITVASLIEREARVPADRPKISRVIHNRLANGWELGIDATVVYATGDNVVTASDLESESPYNTRRFAGLPPTPIALAGRAALEAAIAPATGQWMYYVLTSTDGRHSFSVSNAEFERDKQKCIELDLGCG